MMLQQNVDFDSVWSDTKLNVEKVLTMRQTTGISIYEDVFRLCNSSHSDRLYDSLEKFLIEHVQLLCNVSACSYVYGKKEKK